MNVTSAVVKVYVTERNDAIKRHTNIITMANVSNRSDCIIQKVYVQKWELRKKKNLSWVWRVERKIRPSRSQSDITRQASWWSVMTDSDPWDGFFYLHPNTNDRALEQSVVKNQQSA